MSLVWPREAPTPHPVRLAGEVVLAKREVFAACQALADLGAWAVRVGAQEEARRLGELFDLLEDRLTTRDGRVPSRG